MTVDELKKTLSENDLKLSLEKVGGHAVAREDGCWWQCTGATCNDGACSNTASCGGQICTGGACNNYAGNQCDTNPTCGGSGCTGNGCALVSACSGGADTGCGGAPTCGGDACTQTGACGSSGTGPCTNNSGNVCGGNMCSGTF